MLQTGSPHALHCVCSTAAHAAAIAPSPSPSPVPSEVKLPIKRSPSWQMIVTPTWWAAVVAARRLRRRWWDRPSTRKTNRFLARHSLGWWTEATVQMQNLPPASTAPPHEHGRRDRGHCMHRSSPLSNECFAEDDIAAATDRAAENIGQVAAAAA